MKFEEIFSQLSGAEFKIFFCVLLYFREKEFSPRAIESLAGVSKSGVYQALRRLVNLGFIENICGKDQIIKIDSKYALKGKFANWRIHLNE